MSPPIFKTKRIGLMGSKPLGAEYMPTAESPGVLPAALLAPA